MTKLVCTECFKNGDYPCAHLQQIFDDFEQATNRLHGEEIFPKRTRNDFTEVSNANWDEELKKL